MKPGLTFQPRVPTSEHARATQRPPHSCRASPHSLLLTARDKKSESQPRNLCGGHEKHEAGQVPAIRLRPATTAVTHTAQCCMPGPHLHWRILCDPPYPLAFAGRDLVTINVRRGCRCTCSALGTFLPTPPSTPAPSKTCLLSAPLSSSQQLAWLCLPSPTAAMTAAMFYLSLFRKLNADFPHRWHKMNVRTRVFWYLCFVPAQRQKKENK